MTLTELSIKRPTLILIVFAALTVLGLFGLTQLKYELLPKITPPVVVITTAYPGASPSEVENTVTKPIEDAVSGLDKIDRVNSTSQEGLSFVTIEFIQSADIDVALQDAQRRVNGILATLPEDVRPPVLSKIALDEIPVLRLGATSSLAPREFFQFLKDHVQPQIARIAGVGQVVLVGGEEREIRVNLDADKVRSYGLSIAQVTGAIKASNLDFPTGKIADARNQYIVRVAGKFTSVEEIRNLVIARSDQGGEIRLSNLAEVEDGSRDLTSASRLNGNAAVGILVQKQSDANAVDVSRLVRAQLTKLETAYARHGLKFDVAQDGSTFTTDAADGVKHDLALAVLLVAAVMFLFLHSVRNSLIVMVAIPASLFSTLFVMYLMGFSLNLMTLLGLSLVIGILVDDSIVVLENIYHHLEKGEERRSAALQGRNEIGFAALSITLVDVVVFVPLSLTSGLIGDIMREFAIVVVVSTMMSLFVSFTITPLLASRFSKLEHANRRSLMGKFAVGFEALYEHIKEHYLNLLRWSLVHRKTIVFGTALVFISSVALIPMGFIGNEFITESDRGEFTVFIETPPGATIEHTNLVTLQVEKMIGALPEVRKVFTNVGASSEGFIGQSSNNISELNVTLVPRQERSKSTSEVGREIKLMVQQLPGVKVRVNPIGIFGTANQTPIQIVVGGTNMDDVRAGAAKAMAALQSIPGTADVRLSSEEGKPETRVEVDRQKMAAYGLTMADVGSTLRLALSGDDDSKYRDRSDEYTIRIRLDEFDRSDVGTVGDLTFLNSKGQLIELKQFASIYQASGPTKLQRQDRNGSITVFSQVAGRPSGTIVEEFKQRMAAEKLPAGVSLSYLGDEKNREEGFGSLGLALIAGILFVYMIMVALYDSFVYPFVVLFSIPVAIVGALLALALTMNSLSIFSILGIIMLVGLVAKNAILLVDRANDMRAAGLGVMEALMEAGATRLRPILMTTMAMVIGMLPIALSSGAGSEWKHGLAWALVGGLTSSMFLTLVLVPVVYVKVDQWREALPMLVKRFAGRNTVSVRVPAGA